MTNGDWIRSLTDEELEKNVLNPCKYFECGECQLRNERGRCVVDSTGKSKITMEWLESGHEERAGRMK